MLSQPYYRSILTLTNEFEEKNIPTIKTRTDDDSLNMGLQQIHYRYALQKDPDMADHYKRKMKKFFGDDLEKLFLESDLLEQRGFPRRIYRNCIREGSHLSFYLKNLVDAGLLQRKKHEDKKYRYFTPYPHFLLPVKEICKMMKLISPIAIDFNKLPEMDSPFHYKIDEGVLLKYYFIGMPVPVPTIDNQDDFNTYQDLFKNVQDSLLDLGKFLREASPIHEEKEYEYIRTGLYVDFQLFGDDVVKSIFKFTKEKKEKKS